MGPHGSEVMMIEVVQRAFELAKWRTRVDTGPLTFPLGNNNMPLQSGKAPSDEL